MSVTYLSPIRNDLYVLSGWTNGVIRPRGMPVAAAAAVLVPMAYICKSRNTETVR